MPFDKYTFREEKKDLREALEVRSKRIEPNANVVFIPGSCDSKALLPQQSLMSVRGRSM
jgi:hypothetical protein